MQDKAIELLGIDIEKEKQRLTAMSFMLKALKKPKQEESAEQGAVFNIVVADEKHKQMLEEL